MNRDNIAIICVLQPLTLRGKKESLLIVSNTHILYNPKRGDIKLAQVNMLIHELTSLKDKYIAMNPCVVMGEFICVLYVSFNYILFTS